MADRNVDVIAEHIDWALANGWSPVQVIESVGLRTHPFKLYTWDNAREALARVVVAMRPPTVDLEAPSAMDSAARRQRPNAKRPRKKRAARGPAKPPQLDSQAEADPDSKRGKAKGTKAQQAHREAFKNGQMRIVQSAARARRIKNAPLPEGMTEADMVAEFLASNGATQCPPGHAWGTAERDSLAVHGG